ncbi:MAG: PAS domain S-box protein [Deltaproteobacteria bacterium]|nr:PAS domain S-box protein [Deltaproteobacteria bacterium]
MRLGEATPSAIAEAWTERASRLARRPIACEVVQAAVDAVFETFHESAVLVRAFMTLEYRRLSSAQKACATERARSLGSRARHALGPNTPVFSLLASRGDEPNWRGVEFPGHCPYVPILRDDALGKLTSTLLRDLGLVVQTSEENSDLTASELCMHRLDAGVFCVGSPASVFDAASLASMPREGSSSAKDVQTVFGVGGRLLGGVMLVLLVFSRDVVELSTAQAFLPLMSQVRSVLVARGSMSRIFPNDSRSAPDEGETVTPMILGALADARDTLYDTLAGSDDPVLPAVTHVLAIADRMAEELSSKEAALSSMQASFWTLAREVERALCNEIRYSKALETIGDGLIVLDSRERVEFINKAAERWTGWPSAEGAGRPIDEVFHAVDVETQERVHLPSAAFKTGSRALFPQKTLMTDRGGVARMINGSCALFHSHTGVLLGSVLVFRDITEALHQSSQLVDSERRYRAVFEGAGEGIIVADLASGRILHHNRIVEKYFRHSTAVLTRMTLSDLHPLSLISDARSEYVAIASRPRSFARDLPCVRGDDTRFLADVRVSVVRMQDTDHLVVFFSDASERHATERQLDTERAMRAKAEIELRHAQKLQAVGQLAAGIAHEINSPAQFVGDSLHFLSAAFSDLKMLVDGYQKAITSLSSAPSFENVRRELDDLEEASDLRYLEANMPAALDRAMDGIARISNIVRAMQDFGRLDRREMAHSDLNQALASTLVIAKNEYKLVADIVCEYGDIPSVKCHIGDINQVFLNLVVNAAHAIEDARNTTSSADRGVIRIRTLCEGANVRIDVEDTGSGIPEHIQHRIFDPFFTTKSVGRGSGQGLAIAHAIAVNKHRGSLTFETRLGEGTTFTMRIPVDGAAKPADLHPDVEEEIASVG